MKNKLTEITHMFIFIYEKLHKYNKGGDNQHA